MCTPNKPSISKGTNKRKSAKSMCDSADGGANLLKLWKYKQISKEKIHKNMTKGYEKTTHRKEMQMAVKHLKRCPTSLMVRKIQIESAEMLFFNLLAWQKTQVWKNMVSCEDTDIHIYCWWACTLVIAPKGQFGNLEQNKGVYLLTQQLCFSDLTLQGDLFACMWRDICTWL